MGTTTRRTKKTAAQTYAERGTRVEVLMETLADAVEAHQKKQQGQPGNWGLVGDLAHVGDVLQEAIDFLRGEQ